MARVWLRVTPVMGGGNTAKLLRIRGDHAPLIVPRPTGQGGHRAILSRDRRVNEAKPQSTRGIGRMYGAWNYEALREAMGAQVDT